MLQENVLGFEVTVQDLAGVDVAERLRRQRSHDPETEKRRRAKKEEKARERERERERRIFIFIFGEAHEGGVPLSTVLSSRTPRLHTDYNL